MVLGLDDAVAAADHVGDLIHDDVGARVAQDEVPPDEAILEILGQVRQDQQQIRRHRPQRVLL